MSGSQPAIGCILCAAVRGGDDRRSLLLKRSSAAFLILNAYPYSPGHLMAVVNRHVASVEDARGEELAEAIGLVQTATAALRREYGPDGFNIGINQGRVAGAGIADHLHIHVVPRWNGDTNFMHIVADTSTVPVALEILWDQMRPKFLALGS